MWTCVRRQAAGRGRSGPAGLCVLLAVAGLVSGGCSMARKTDTARTAVEQLLLSTAADRALGHLTCDPLKGRKAFVDVSNLETYDKGYVTGAIRDALGARGVRLVADAKQADVIVEARSGALAIDGSEFLLGIPSLPIPIPGAGVVQTPELAIFKRVSQQGVAKLALSTLQKGTGEQILSTGPLAGDAYYNRFTILFIQWKSTDIPEEE